MHRPDRVSSRGNTAEFDPTCAADPTAAVFVIDGEVGSEVAGWLETIAARRLEGGAHAVVIDCTAIPGPSGCLLGALRRLALLPGLRRVTIGVAADASTASVIGGHVPSLVTAPNLASVLTALGAVSEAHPVRLIGRRTELAAEPDRTLGWAAPELSPLDGRPRGGRGFFGLPPH